MFAPNIKRQFKRLKMKSNITKILLTKDSVELGFNHIRNILFVVIALTMSGCAIVPQQIDVDDTSSLINFEQISQQPNKAPDTATQHDKKARWGGKIVSVQNKKEVSEIEIVFFPENRFGKPQTGSPSVGRFKAVVTGFIDPLVFEQGRLITIVGQVSDSQTGVIGEQEYIYPTLNAKGYYMWKDVTETRVELDSFAFSPFGFHAGIRHSYFRPWYNTWHLRNQRMRARIERRNGHSQGGYVDTATRALSNRSDSRVDQVRTTNNEKTSEK